MTNEEMALCIQSGHTELYAELWAAVSDLIAYMSVRLYTQYQNACVSAGVTVEDIIQSGYIALVDAVAAYKPDKGYAFTTYINFPLLNQLKSQIGMRRGSSDALNHSISLETPISNDTDGETVIGDTIPDRHATAEMQNVIDDVFNCQLHNALMAVCDTLAPLDSNLIKAKYFNNLSVSELAERFGMSRCAVSENTRRILPLMRKGTNYKKLSPFANEIFSKATRNTGVYAFNAWRGSSTELTAEWIERYFINRHSSGSSFKE